jgi:predicted outer membrane repeat protein
MFWEDFMKLILSTAVMVYLSLMTAAQAATNYVNGTAGNDSYDGLAPVWDGAHGPKQTIQAAVNISASNDTVQVAAGTYTGTGNTAVSFAGRVLTIESAGGTANTTVDGGGINQEFDCADADVIIRGFKFLNSPLAVRAGGAFDGPATVQISSCLFSNCIGTGPDELGAVFVGSGSTAVIADSTFQNSQPAVLVRNSGAASITNCVFTGDNTYCTQVLGWGGGMGGPTINISDCQFRNNYTAGNGAAISFESVSTVIKNSQFISNRCDGAGGAIYMYGGWPSTTPPVIENCLFAGNHVAQSQVDAETGGAIFSGIDAGITIRNSTFVGNTSSNGTWGKCMAALNADIRNCIFWDNGWPYTFSLSGGTITHCDVQHGLPVEWDPTDGGGNIDDDPNFYSASAGNYHVRLSSPCVDSGTSSNAPAYDLDGFARPQSGGYDMGCYEFADTDNDQIADWWEKLYYGGPTNANPAAIASNGINTTVECYIAGLNPANPAAFFSLSSLSPLPSGNVLRWNATPGLVYSIYWTSNLLNGFSEVLQSNYTGEAFTDLVHGAASESFYRLEVQEP